MKTVSGCAAALALAAFVSTAPAAQERTEATRQEDGRTLFVTYCASCHGNGGRGDGPVAETLRTRPADLTRLAANNRAFVADRIHRLIDGREPYVKAHGSMEMPVWGDAFKRRDALDDAAIAARIDAIVKYLQSIQQRVG